MLHPSVTDERYRCRMCFPMRMFGDVNSLEIHKSSKHKMGPYYKCGRCQKDFAAKSRANRHIREVHKDSSIEIQKHFR